MADDNKLSMKAPAPAQQGRLLQRQQLLDVIAMLWDDKNSPPLEGICKDISGSGMLVELSDPIPIGTLLRVSLHSNQNREHLTSLAAKVVRSHKNKWGSYTTGLEIIHNQTGAAPDSQ